MLRSNRPGRTGVEVVRAIGGPDDQDVGRGTLRLAQLVAVGEPCVHGLDDLAAHADRPRGLLERLQLDEQLVDDAGDAFALCRPRAPLAADGIELLDEADGSALASRLAAELLEVGADLAVGLSVEHGPVS